MTDGHDGHDGPGFGEELDLSKLHRFAKGHFGALE